MTLNQLLRAWSRRWYVLLAFLLIVVAAAVLSTRATGVYWTRVDVVFLPPSSADNQNTLSAATESLVDFAAIVERQFNGNRNPPRFSSEEATLYGSGVREGNRVSLVDTGGQWTDSFVRPQLSVEVVGASESEVRDQLTAALTRIEAVSVEQQQDAAVPPAELIHTLASPSSAVIEYAGGSQTRTVAAILLLGFLLSGAGTVLVDWLILRRKRSNPL